MRMVIVTMVKVTSVIRLEVERWVDAPLMDQQFSNVINPVVSVNASEDPPKY